jgi:hypothetical protein
MRATRPGDEPAQQYRALAIAQLQRIAGLEHCDPGLIALWVESGVLVRALAWYRCSTAGRTCTTRWPTKLRCCCADGLQSSGPARAAG